MSDPPEAEAKPSTSDLPDAVWDRALEAGSLLDAVTIAFAAGRAQAAADIRSARLMRYFWLPCPLCGREFGGHEWRDAGGRLSSVPDPLGGPTSSVGICPRCTRAGRGVDVAFPVDAE